MHSQHILASVVTIIACIGAINWLLTSMKYNVVEKALKKDSSATKAVYAIIGICGILALFFQVKWIMSPTY